jgi:UDP-glucose 4-epimerase
VKEGAEVHVLTSSVSSIYPVRLLDIRKDVTVHGGNLNDRWALDHVVTKARPEVVFHLGAYTHVGKSWERADECIQTNVQGSVNLFQSLSRYDFRRFVYTSTSEVYGDIAVPFNEEDQVRPLSPYSVSKYAGELFCRMLHKGMGWPIVVVRPFNAYGPAQSPDRVIPEVIVKALRGERLQMTQGSQTREFNYVDDLVEGFLRAGTVPGIENEVINIGGGEEISMKDLAIKILGLMGDPIEAEIGSLPERPTEIPVMRSDPSKAQRLLGGPLPRSLDEGLMQTIEWYRQELGGLTSSFSA